MRYCSRCVLPDTKPGVVFDDGVCSACRSVERKQKIDWPAREAELRAMCDRIRGSNGDGYECIVPVSGGKDSFFQAYMMSRVYKLRTLAVIVAPHLQTIEGIENLNNLVNVLDVDLIKITIRPSIQQKIRRVALLKVGNPNYAEHRVIFAAVARAAFFHSAPLVVWGEDISVEFGGTVASTSASNGSAEELINNDLFREVGFSELLGGSIPDRDLFFYMDPSADSGKRRAAESIYLGYYHWWDGIKHYDLAKRHGFQARRLGPLSGNVLAYDNIDEKLCEIHLWFKFLKLGFWRATDHCCYKIWNGYMTRQEAVERVREVQYQFPVEYFKEFLEYHQLTESDFWSCAERFRNLDIWHKINGEWRLKNELA